MNVLSGTRILVTAQRRAADQALALARRGAEVDVASALGVESHIDEDGLLQRTEALIADPPDVVVITTGIGFRGWWETVDTAGTGDELLAALEATRLIARGPKARGALQAAGLKPDWVAESETSAEIGRFLTAEGVDGLRIAVQHHGAGDDGLETLLTAHGADVTGLVVYRWGPPPDPGAVRQSVLDAAAGLYDAVTFTSAPGVAAWLAEVRAAGVWSDLLEVADTDRLMFAAVGPVTAEPLLTVGLVPIVPDRGRLGALIRSLVLHLGSDDRGVPTSAGRLRVHATAATLDHRLLGVSPSGLAVLRRLIERPGTVVSREELLDVLPGDSSDPHTAEVAVARLREAMGPGAPIKTVVKRGYRLDTSDRKVAP